MEKNEKMEKENPQNTIDAVVKIDEAGKRESQLIAFRADFESSKRIEVLEKIMSKGKTDILKEAIKVSFDGLLMSDTIARMSPKVKKKFTNARIIHAGLGSRKEDDEESPFNFSPDAGIIVFELPEYKKCKCDDKNVKSNLEVLIFELKVEGLKTIKLEITKPLILADINKIDAQLLKDLQITALKHSLELKSSKIGKEMMHFQFKLERNLNVHEKWMEPFEKDMQTLHDSMEDIKKLTCFKKEESTK